MDWRRGSLFLLRIKKVAHKFGNIKTAEAEASPEKPAMSSSPVQLYTVVVKLFYYRLILGHHILYYRM